MFTVYYLSSLVFTPILHNALYLSLLSFSQDSMRSLPSMLQIATQQRNYSSSYPNILLGLEQRNQIRFIDGTTRIATEGTDYEKGANTRAYAEILRDKLL
jgi:hypothetical protein